MTDQGHGKRPQPTQVHQDEQAPPKHSGRSEPWWQWLIAAAGALLLITTAAYLAYRGIALPATSPRVVLTVRNVVSHQDGYVVIVQAENRGGQTAAGVKIRGTLERQDQPLASGEFTIDYLPPHSPRHGGLFFDIDPGAPGVELKLQAEGYARP